MPATQTPKRRRTTVKKQPVKKSMHPVTREALSYANALYRRYEPHLTEATHTLKHLAVFAGVFMVVVVLFLIKEGRVFPATGSTATAQPRISEAPRADVGIRMLLDKGTGELGQASRSAQTAPTPVLPPLDLAGPWQCSVTTQTGSMSLSIDRKKVRFTAPRATGVQNVLISGDCIYDWTGKSGIRQCGISQSIDTVESLTNSGLVSVSSLLSQQFTDPSRQNAMLSLLASCKKTAVSAGTFTTPTDVTWKTAAATDGSSSELMMLFK